MGQERLRLLGRDDDGAPALAGRLRGHGIEDGREEHGRDGEHDGDPDTLHERGPPCAGGRSWRLPSIPSSRPGRIPGMDYRTLGKTGLRVSALGFGCGNVGGLMIRGAPAERERAVARGLELGINYFDTAPSYGDGLSERHLGQALRALRATPYVGTKFRLEPAEWRDAAGAIPRALEGSLERLGMERVDLFQLHNPIGGLIGATPSADQVLNEVVPALERLREQGKLRFYGITALGDTAALHRVVGAGRLDTAQVCYNLLDPSAGDGGAGRVPGPGLRPPARPGRAAPGRRHRDPRARRRSAQRLGDAPPGGGAVGRPDRVRPGLRDRRRARPGARPAGERGPRRQPGRGCAPLPARARGGVHGAPRLLEPRAPRGGRGGGRPRDRCRPRPSRDWSSSGVG